MCHQKFALISQFCSTSHLTLAHFHSGWNCNFLKLRFTRENALVYFFVTNQNKHCNFTEKVKFGKKWFYEFSRQNASVNPIEENLIKIKTLQFHEKNPTFWSFIFWSKWRWFSGFQERQSAKNKSMIYDYIFGNSSFSIFFFLYFKSVQQSSTAVLFLCSNRNFLAKNNYIWHTIVDKKNYNLKLLC